MGRALALGAIEAGAVASRDLLAFDIHPEAVRALTEETGARGAESLAELVTQSQVLLLCTKPHDVATVLGEVARQRSPGDDLLVLSIAAGVTLGAMEHQVAGCARVIRAMPNTPALIGKGAAAFSLGTSATRDDAGLAAGFLGAVGEVTEVKESLLDAVTGLSGSGPAYVYLFIEALTDAGVRNGLSREQAGALATQTVAGAAAMVRETKEHPAVLRDMVTSPGGTTIAGLTAMEAAGFRHACHEAVDAATRRSRELGT